MKCHRVIATSFSWGEKTWENSIVQSDENGPYSRHIVQWIFCEHPKKFPILFGREWSEPFRLAGRWPVASHQTRGELPGNQ